ncbi:MAG: hypothetical protein GY851_23100 [bacterium]|nr:hypothetical protein [bacterium]
MAEGILYFSADDGLHGRELWQVDSQGVARLARDVLPGPEGSNPRKLCPATEGVYFIVDLPEEASGDVALWRHSSQRSNTNGDQEFPADAEPAWLVPCRDGVLFDTFYPDQGRELAFHGKTAPKGTAVRDIAQGPEHGVSAEKLIDRPFEGRALFKARTREQGDWKLWMTDGTPDGTLPILPDVALGPNVTYGEPTHAVAVGSRLFFSGAASLWLVTAEQDGAFVVKHVPGPGAPRNFCEFRDAVYFQAEDQGHGAELWRTDGTPEGTRMVKDIQSGPPGSAPYALRALDDAIVFNADDGLHGVELWRSDGTADGTVLVRDVCRGPAGANTYQNTVHKGRVFFAAEHPGYGEELWCTDGTAAGTVLVKEIHPGAGDAEPYYLTVYGDLLYFCANDGVHGEELWCSDGTDEGTRLVLDIHPESHRIRSSNPVELAVFAGCLYFVADDVTHGAELWVCEAGADPPGPAYLLKDVHPGNGHSDPEYLTATPNRLLFAADDGEHGSELWETDGTPSGTRMVTELHPGSEGGHPRDLVLLSDAACFVATPAPNRQAIFALAPDQDTPEVLIDVNSFVPNGTVASIGVIAERLFACVQSDDGLVRFLCCDGSSASARFVSEHGAPMLGAWEHLRALSAEAGETPSRDMLHAYLLMPGRPHRAHARMGKTLVFAASSADHGCELWRSDGGLADAQLLKDCYPGPGSSAPSELTVVDGTLYFAAERVGGKRELWRSDGTAEGTYAVPGAVGYGPEELAVYQNRLLMTVHDLVYKGGARLLAHEHPSTGLVGIVQPRGHSNERPYYVRGVAVIDNHVFFSASMFGVGQELCALRKLNEARVHVVNVLSEGPYDGVRCVEVVESPTETAFTPEAQ